MLCSSNNSNSNINKNKITIISSISNSTINSLCSSNIIKSQTMLVGSSLTTLRLSTKEMIAGMIPR